MKKRILASLVALATVMSFAGCQTDTNSSTPDSSTPDSSNSGNSSESTPDSSTPDNSDVSSTPDDTTDFVVDKENPQKIDTGVQLSDSEGKVLNIWAWNDEFKGFFEKYYKVPDG